MSLFSAMERNRAAFGLLNSPAPAPESGVPDVPTFDNGESPVLNRYSLFGRGTFPQESFAAGEIAYPALPERREAAGDDPSDLLFRRLEIESRQQPQREEEF